MEYLALVRLEDDHFVIMFPDCPGCVTQAESESEIIRIAQDALEGWLESHLKHGEAPPHASATIRGRPGWRVRRVPVSFQLSVKLLIRWARQDADLTQADLAKKVGVKQPQIAKLERPGVNLSLKTLERVLDALGIRVELGYRREHVHP